MEKLPDAFSPEQLDELLSDAAKAELARPVIRFDPRWAEIAGAAKWWVIEVFSDRKTAEELAKLRFGVYMPASKLTSIRRGREVDSNPLMFPGYVFVLVWGMTDHHWNSIVTTPGVLGVVGQISEEELMIVRQAEADERATVRVKRSSPAPAKKKYKRPRASRKAQRKANAATPTDGAIALAAFGSGIRALDSEVRNQTLRKAVVPLLEAAHP